MEIFKSIEGWIYPVMDLALFIYCLVKLKSNGAIYFILGFGIQFFASLIWRVLPFFKGTSENGLSKIYEIYNHVSVSFYIISLVLLIIGLSVISKQGTMQTSASYQGVSVRKFGNFVLYIILLMLGFIPFIIGISGFYAGNTSDYENKVLFLILMVFGSVLIMIAQILFLVMFYRVWHFAIYESKRLKLVPSIQTPGMAIGYLFIPFYNFYWAFMAYGKISTDLNAIARAKNASATLSNGLGLVIPILCITGIIPFAGIFTGFIALVLFPIFIHQAMAFCVWLSQLNNVDADNTEKTTNL